MIVGTTYVLTAELDEDSFAWLDGLRRRNFPPERNFLPAHLTMFHKLSSTQIARLRLIDLPTAPVTLYFDRILFLGFGVALHVRSHDLEQLRGAVQLAMGGEFMRQDSQAGWKPHVTVQNKVTVENARKLQQTLETEFNGRAGAVTGLLIWEYLGGPWKLFERFTFANSA